MKFFHSLLHHFYMNFLMWKRRFLESPVPMSSPKIPIEILIEKTINRMKIIPLCPYDKVKMMFRCSQIIGVNPIRDDITFKCPKCFFTAHFGIPISKEAYEKELELRQSKILMQPNYSFNYLSKEDEKKILARLKALGYLG